MSDPCPGLGQGSDTASQHGKAPQIYMNGGMRVKREGILRKGTMAVAAITIAAALVMSGCAADAGTQDGISTEATGETQTQTPEETLSQEAATQDTASQEQTTTQEQKETQTTTAAETTAQTYEFEQGLYEFYKDDFMVGVALPSSIVRMRERSFVQRYLTILTA